MLFGSLAIPESPPLKIIFQHQPDYSKDYNIPVPLVYIVHGIGSFLFFQFFLFLVNLGKLVEHVGKRFLLSFLLSFDSLLADNHFILCSLKFDSDANYICKFRSRPCSQVPILGISQNPILQPHNHSELVEPLLSWTKPWQPHQILLWPKQGWNSKNLAQLQQTHKTAILV